MQKSQLVEIKEERFTAVGKFLITGEYAVLDNVDALAIPLKLKQHLSIEPKAESQIEWIGRDVDQSVWMHEKFKIDDTGSVTPDPDSASKLIEVLQTALQLAGKEGFSSGFTATTTLDFDRQYGMGTSSTFIAMVAQWIGCDPFELQFKTFGGSGYDIACATASKPIIYNYNDAQPEYDTIDFNPSFHKNLFFIYLNQKQNSRDSIAQFDASKLSGEIREELNTLPKKLVNAQDDLIQFQELIVRHELLISELIGLEPVKEKLFADYNGAIKSLGGWGGDFILAAGDPETPTYFRSRGYEDIYHWNNLIAH
ncbi:GYDIA family GHMP kinase [Nonlabens ponticola]|uniref:GHMP kinase n=1 Tax=Nonlabens ponticola TaxID=2496866 RepID=A0A3S9MWV3_9FLAO|nr:GYDIA family GHMP kinase [Nonlabens ponticola]AZQ43617.1 hypothetical protein EJ995_04970 [Nonlabens ponticola]